MTIYDRVAEMGKIIETRKVKGESLTLEEREKFAQLRALALSQGLSQRMIGTLLQEGADRLVKDKVAQ